MPASARGCSACSSSALTPPAIIDGKSAWTCQQTASGPNRPGSPGGEAMSRVRPPEARVMPRTWVTMRSRSEVSGVCMATMPARDR